MFYQKCRNLLNIKVYKHAILCLFAFLLACSPSINDGGRITDADRLKGYADPELKMTREQFRSSMLPNEGKPVKKERSSEPEIPEVSDILTTPSEPEAVPDKLISLSVTEDVPLKDVLIEMSRLADVDMEIDPGITGGIILRVKDKPFKDVIERVVSLGGLRYSTKNGVVRVERDSPYQVDYKVDFLNIVRTNESSVTTNTTVFGGSSSSSSSGSSSGTSSSSSSSSSTSSSGTSGSTGSSSTSGNLTSGSSNSITSTSEGDLWESVQNGIQAMLNFTEGNNITGSVSSTSNVGISTGSSSTGSTSASTGTSNLQMNRQAGIISVIATKRQHESINAYLTEVKRQVSAQVLIEAKVVEVTLNNEYRSGIDWGSLADSNIGLKLSGNFKGGIGTTGDFLTVGGFSGTDKNLSTAVSLTEAFGTTRTLSSPRLHAINNQQAVLTFAENKVYFTVQVEEAVAATSTTPAVPRTITSTPNTVPIGVILALQPSINLDTKEITMHVRPTLSRITDEVQDPAVTEPNEIPVVEVRELDSILKIKSGDVMVIGGLMKDDETNNDNGIPYAGRVPVLGNLFKSKVNTKKIIETVIFIKATIVPSGDSVEKVDQHFYNTFTKDPRPLAF